MSAYLSRPLFRQDLSHVARGGQADHKRPAQNHCQPRNRVEEYSRGFMMDGGTHVRGARFYYVGPSDGHNLDHLLPC